MKKKHALFLVVPAASLILTGCLDDILGFGCGFSSDSDHCYQSAAVQGSDTDECAKIKGEGFKGSNPPRDKCYLQIAENTGDYSACDKIQGGLMSYTKEQCIMGAAVSHDDPAGCKKLKGADYASCKEQVGVSIGTDKLTEISEAVEAAKSEAGANPDDKEAQKKLADLIAKQNDLFEFASDGTKGQYFKDAREKIMEDVEDDDVKSAIAKTFTAYRSQNPNVSLNDQIKEMQKIKDQQDLIKSLDEQANTLMDQIKDGANDFASDTMDDLYGEDIEKYKEAMQEKGMKYLEEKMGAKNLKRGMEQLEWMQEKYDKASEQYEAISEKLEKLKKVYDEVKEVAGKIDEINKMVAEGKIDPGRAKVLHGAIYLGKGLEYATGYVPVFGSTISTISKETFDATVKFATKRAQRTTALDKCIEDPLNCDPNGISAY